MLRRLIARVRAWWNRTPLDLDALDRPVGEIPPGWTMAALRAEKAERDRKAAEYADRVLAEALAEIVTDPGLVAELQRLRTQYVTRHGIRYDVETLTDPTDFEAAVASAMEVVREGRKGWAA